MANKNTSRYLVSIVTVVHVFLCVNAAVEQASGIDGSNSIKYVAEFESGGGVMVPGFVRAVKSSDSYFDTLFDVRNSADATNVLAATDLYATTTLEYVQYAYSTYMRLEGGCKYDFKGYYDDRVFVTVGGQCALQSSSDCESVIGYYRAPTSGWYLVELRVWNRGGPGGGSEGIKYKLESDTGWQTFEDPGDGSKFRAVVGADSLPVIDNAPVAIGEYGAETVGDYRWEFYVTEHGVVIQSRNWEDWRPAVTPAPVGDIIVPRQLNGRQVVGIGNYAFVPDWESEEQMNITSIDIPDSVTFYGDQVFGYGCNFEEFEFKEGVTNIGNYVLMECYNLKKLKIPGTLQAAGYQPFGGGWYGASSLQEIELGEGLKEIGDNWFSGLYSIEELVIPSTVTNIGSWAFSELAGYSYDGYDYSHPISIVLPQGLKRIGDYAFGYSGGLREIVVPDGVNYVGEGAFESCGNLTNIVLGSGVKQVPKNLCRQCSNLSSVVLRSLVDRVNDYAFSDCRNLATFPFSTNLTYIGERAFSGCEVLSDINLPECMAYIGNYAFAYCYGIKSIRLPSGINQDSKSLFQECRELVSVDFPADLTRIGGEWFSGCRKMCLASLPDGVEDIGDRAFYDCDAIESLMLPSSLTHIGQSVFANCDHLSDVNIPSSLRDVYDYSFNGCKALTNLTISSGVEAIGDSAFYGCESLKTVDLPDTIKTIRNQAFRNCRSLERISVPDSVTYIGGNVFSGNTSLREFQFPMSYTYVQPSMFSDCTSLTNVVLHDAITRIYSSAFYNCSALEHIHLPSSLQRIESDAFGLCSSLREIVVPDSVTYIGGMAFRHCRSLERVVLPSGLTEIGGAAFFNCESLHEIVIPASVARLNDRQFAGGLNALKAVRFMGEPPSVSSWNSTFGEGTANHEFTVYYPVEFSTAWSAAVDEIVAMGINCHAVLPYEGYHAWLSTDSAQYAEGESVNVTIHLSNAFEGDVYAYLVPMNEDAINCCAISGITGLGETNESQTVCLAPGTTEYVVTNGFTFIDGPAEPSFEVLVLTNLFTATFTTNTIYASEALNLAVSNVPPVIIASPSGQFRVDTEIGREERIGWFARDVGMDECEGFDYNWWVGSSWRGSGIATNGELAVTFNEVGEKSVRLRVADKDGGVSEKVIRYWIDPESYKTVTFDLGEHGERCGGGALSQLVKVGEDAFPPEVETDPDEDYVFDGWDAGYANVMSNVAIHAVYRYSPVPREFRLSLSSETLLENQSSGIKLIVKRTGTPSKSLEVQLHVDKEGVLDIPQSVVIPAGNSSVVVTVKPVNNTLVDGRRIVNVTCSAEKYADGEIAITVADDEVPSVRIELDGDRIREGGSVLVGRVVRDLVTDEPLTVYLSGVSTTRCSYPGTVVIPAGESAASFEVSAVNNDTAEVLANMTLRVAAAGYIGDTKVFAVEDDDIPGVRLDIYPEQVSEGAGAKAAYATLTRTDDDKIARAITVRLTGSDQLILPSSITIPANTLAVRFPIGTVDNALDDGDRIVEVTGAILIESCGCGAQPSNGEAIVSQLTIIDDDRPSLTLAVSPSTLKEGVEEAGWLTVSHNSYTSEDVVVVLSYDVAGEIDLPEEILIPAGQQFAKVPIRTLDDGVQDGGRLVSIYAEDSANVFASGSAWVQVSDQNLPDLCLESLSVSPNPIVGGSNCSVVLSVANNGVVSHDGTISYRAYWINGNTGFSAEGAANKTGRIDGGLGVAESKEISFGMPTPSLPGNYQLVVAIDPDRNIPDLDELNNEARSEEVSVMPSFTTTATADQRVYLVGDTITISGTAINADGVTPAVNQKIEVYLIVDDVRRSYETMTDADGDFSLVFEPQPGEMGHYVVGACYPNQGSSVPQNEFDILGFWRNPNNYVISDLVVGEHVEHRVPVRNKSFVSLTGVGASVVGLPDCVDIDVSVADSLSACSVADILVSLDAVSTTVGNEYIYFSVKLESAEGASLSIPMAVYVSPTQAKLTATPQDVKKTVSVGKPSYLTYTISNEGAGVSGRIQIAMPDVSWIRVVSGAVIDNLNPGESAKILVEVIPPVALSLNKLYSGAIGVGCENGQMLSLGLSLIPVSEENGSLKVDVVDTLTLTMQGAPHVAGARVTVTNPATGVEVAHGETDGEGVFLVTDIPAGSYEVSVTADSHTSKRMEMIVSPGAVSSETVYLAYTAVSYSWQVTRTEIEDKYSIDLVMEYDTSVPAPAMKVKAPDEIPALREGESFVCGIEIENCGLIALQDLRLSLGGSIGDYTYEQISPDVKLLPAKSSQTIYVKFTNPSKRTRLLSTASRSGITTDDIGLAQYAPCTVFMQVFARAVCGEEGVEVLMNSNNIRMLGHVCDLMAFTAMQIMNALGNLGGTSNSAPSRGPGSTSGGEPWAYLNDPPVSSEKLDCACIIKLIDITLGLGLERLGLGDLKSLYEEMNDWMEIERKAQSGELDPLKVAGNAASRLMDIKNKIKGEESKIADVYEKLRKALELLEDCSRAIGWEKISKAIGKAHEAIAAMNELANVLSAVESLCGGKKTRKTLKALEDSPDEIDPAIVREFTEGCVGLDNLLRRLGYRGIAEADMFFGDMMEEFRAIREGSDALAVCSTVSFQLSQTVTMTREAFEGSLTLQNSDFSGRLTNVRLLPIVTDADGNNRTDLFGITDRSHSGFSGMSFLGGDLELDGGANGTANVLFVPTVQAAVDEPTLYYFGGDLSYYDSVLGETVTHRLIPVPLVVNPCPQLTLDYFVQRDVCGDDPFTSDVVEPSEPAELAVLIQNNGKGEAKNTVIKSIQPTILENDKGLLIDFALKDYSLDATALNGSTAHLGLSDVSLGTIGAGECAVAQWWLTSSIEGHFTDVSATVTHLNSWGNPDTSLIRDVRVHKLVRSVVADDDGLPDFLTTTDAFGNPEEMYTSGGDIVPVRNDAKCSVEGALGDESVSLVVSATAMESGWQCLACTIDGLSDYVVESVTREDGEPLPAKNVWITDRVFRNGTNPLRRDDLHFVDCVESAGPTVYVVNLIRRPSAFPEVAYFAETATGVENSVRDSVTVVFASPIDPATFSWMDVTLVAQGEWVGHFNHYGVVAGLQSLSIEPVDDSNTKFSIRGLRGVCSSYGRYELTVQCAGIQDSKGNYGRTGKSFSWIYNGSDPAKPCVVRSRGIEGECVYVLFPGPVAENEVSLDKFALQLNGEDVSLPSNVVVKKLSDREFMFSGLDDVFSSDGDYRLSYGESNVTSWQIRTQPPAAATDLFITPDYGESASDGVTCVSQLTVHGTLAPDTPIAHVYYVVPSGEPVMISDCSRNGQEISANLDLEGGGNVTFIIRSSDTFGNESEATINAFVDTIPLFAKLQMVDEPDKPVEGVSLSFDDDVIDDDVGTGDFELTRNGNPISLSDVQLVKIDSRNFVLNGLGAVCNQDGVYRLTYDSTSVRKRTSGLKASTCESLMWEYKNKDYEPPTVTAVLFDGETPHEAYTNVFSTVAVSFSEAVNVPELIENGLIEKAARIDLLNAANAVTGSAVVASTMMWDGESNTLSWQIDPLSVPAGRTRLMIDAGLIADLAGNHLSADGYAVTNGMRTYALSETALANVNAQAMPTWYNGELYVGEKTADNKGKIRHYVANGTWTYLHSDGVDIEIPAQGCQGASVAFADMDGDGVSETYVGTAIGNVLKYPGGETIASLGTNRAMPYAYDLDGDGCDELITGGMDGHIRVISFDVDAGTYSMSLVSDVNGTSLTVPNGRAAPVVADIDHDGIADIVSGDTAGNIWAYLGDGNAWCAQPLTVFTNNVTLADRSRLGYGDVDGDGIEDLIVGRSDGSVTVMLGAETPSPTVSFAVKAVVSASTGVHGEIAPVGDTAYDGGDTPEYVIAPDVGYHVADVLVDGVSIGATNNYVFTSLITSHTIHAEFAINTFAVTFEAGAHGALSGTTEQTIDYGGTAVAPSVTPDAGYEFTGWSGDVTAPVVSNVTFTAQYATIPYAITYTGLKGATNPNPLTYTVEDEVTFAAPGDVYGWVFKGWTPASIALGMTGEVEASANWERQKFDVTVNGETRQYDYEEEVTFTAPEPTVDELRKTQFVYVGTSYTAPVVTNEFTVSVTNGIEFAWDIIATNYWFETATVQNGSIIAPDTGWMAHGTNFVIEAVSADHYHFVSWAGDTNGCEAAGLQIEVVMDQARTIGAEFAIDTFAVTFEAGAHGALSGTTEQTIDYGGTAVAPSVTPDAGYEFTGWSGDVTATVVSNATFTAQYEAITYNIVYTGLMGTANPNPATYTVEDAITFAAPGAVYGWVFMGWTPASIALGMTGEVEASANWERQKFDVTVNGETRQYSYEDIATLVTNDFINIGATQYVCKGWTATNADLSSGEGARAEFRVLGDVSFNWLWETNIVTLAQSVNAADLGWTTGGAAEWQPEWSDAANDSLHHARSGTIGNNTNTWIETTIEGAGTLSFVWKSSTEAKYDMFQLIVDGEVKGTISGETPWTTNNIVLAGGAHTIRWNYRKSRSGTAGADMVWLDSVTWTADVPPTLAEALNPDLFWMTDGDVEWTAVRKDTILDPHDDWATVGGLSDYESSLVGTEVYGAGVLTFDWAVSCEDGYDWFDFIAEGEIRESITGETGWKTVTIEFKTSGKHILQWEYWKDDMDEAELVGDNCARLDNVRWTPVSAESQYTTTTLHPIPFADIRTSYSNYWLAAEGDYEVAAHMIGRNGCAIWESYVAGLVPDDENSKFTAKIDILPDGTPNVTWEPDTPELRATRVYKTLGKKTLMDKDWVDVTDKDQSEYHFFTVTVDLP